MHGWGAESPLLRLLGQCVLGRRGRRVQQPCELRHAVSPRRRTEALGRVQMQQWSFSRAPESVEPAQRRKCSQCRLPYALGARWPSAPAAALRGATLGGRAHSDVCGPWGARARRRDPGRQREQRTRPLARDWPNGRRHLPAPPACPSGVVTATRATAGPGDCSCAQNRSTRSIASPGPHLPLLVPPGAARGCAR